MKKKKRITQELFIKKIELIGKGNITATQFFGTFIRHKCADDSGVWFRDFKLSTSI